jgi:SAM-dependent methyltransferase
MLDRKQNVFDDFICAGAWLVEQGITRPSRLAITGGSNGGLLVGAALTQRPDLFRAVVCQRMRPGYPAALFDDLAELAPPGRMLEIGPGTGQATSSLIERGYSVTAVELSPTLAGGLRARLGNAVDVVVGAFEDFRLDGATPFDVVFSATAFHWVDPRVRLLRAAEVLRAGGALATVRTEHIEGGTTPFFNLVQQCYEQWDPATPRGLRLEPSSAFGFEPLAGPGAELFEEPVYRRYEWEQTYTAAEYRDLLLTYSGHRALSRERQAGLLECITLLADREFGGRVTKAYMNELRVSRKR